MADTSSSKAVTKKERGAKEIFKDYKDYEDYEVEDLKPWHIMAITRFFLFEDNYAQIGRDIGRNKTSVARVVGSPGGQAVLARLKEKIGDPTQLAKDLARASVLGVATDWYMALEWAKEARDYRSVAQMSKDLAALGGLQATPPKQEVETTKTIRIVLDSDDLDTKAVEANWEVITEDDDE